MARVVAQKGLNPYAPEFIPTLYPLLTTSSPDHHYYLPAPPDTFFCYHSPSLRTFSSSQTFYTNLCFPTTQPASLLLPPPQKDLVSVIEPTIAFVAERPPEEAAHAPQNDAVVEHKMVATKKTSPRRYRNQYYGGRGGAWAWWEKDGDGESLKKYASKVDPLNKYARGRSRPEAKKKNYSSVLPVQCGVRKTTIMIRNIPSKYTYILILSRLSLSLSL